MNEQEDKLVEELAAPIIQNFKATKRFYSRNRKSWKRMNRPSQLAKAEKGADFIMAFLSRSGG